MNFYETPQGYIVNLTLVEYVGRIHRNNGLSGCSYQFVVHMSSGKMVYVMAESEEKIEAFREELGRILKKTKKFF